MSKEDLILEFERLFPNFAKRVTRYKKTGSKTLAMVIVDDQNPNIAKSRIFFYDNPDNWQFGTKLWRKRPERVPKKGQRFTDYFEMAVHPEYCGKCANNDGKLEICKNCKSSTSDSGSGSPSKFKLRKDEGGKKNEEK